MVSSEKILSAARHNWWLNNLGFALSFVAPVVLVPVLPPQVYAQYSAVLAIVAMATLVFEAGANSGLTRYLPEAAEQHARGSFYRRMRHRRWLAALTCGAALLVFGPAYARTTQLGAETAQPWLFVLIATVVATSLTKLLAQYALIAKSSTERAAIGADLRAQVERLHSLPRLADRILAELKSGRGKLAEAIKREVLEGQIAVAR
jgi:hypothetical protein